MYLPSIRLHAFGRQFQFLAENVEGAADVGDGVDGDEEIVVLGLDRPVVVGDDLRHIEEFADIVLRFDVVREAQLEQELFGWGDHAVDYITISIASRAFE